MFIAVILVLALIAALIGTYIYRWLRNLLRLLRKKTAPRWLTVVTVIAAVVLTALSFYISSVLALILLHFWIFSALGELVAVIVRRLWRNRPALPRWLLLIYRTSLIPAVIVAALMLYGVGNMANIRQTDYALDTEKTLSQERWRVVFLSDTHYDTIQDPALVRDMAARIDALEPDIVILGGDIVEEGTSKASMEAVFRLLGGLKNKCGIYYVYGNHDRQTYSGHPSYTEEELAAAITGNGIRLLCDEAVEIGEDILLVGREDSSHRRQPMESLLAGQDTARLIVTADHQPKEGAENGKRGVDIQLSGHTHGGQIWPIGTIEELFGPSCGAYTLEGNHLYVSSGVAGWGFPIRTEARCEFVVLDIR